MCDIFATWAIANSQSISRRRHIAILRSGLKNRVLTARQIPSFCANVKRSFSPARAGGFNDEMAAIISDFAGLIHRSSRFDLKFSPIIHLTGIEDPIRFKVRLRFRRSNNFNQPKSAGDPRRVVRTARACKKIVANAIGPRPKRSTASAKYSAWRGHQDPEDPSADQV